MSRPRVLFRLGLADAVTAANAALGFLAAALAPSSPELAARLVLLAAVADGLDGVLAGWLGATPVGEFLDSLADVASFGVAPALVVVAVAREKWNLALTEPAISTALWLSVPTAFVVVSVLRLGLYTAYDIDRERTEGVQTTLAATVLAVAYLAGMESPLVLLGAMAAFVVLMVAPVGYPDLRARDALVMGVVQALAIVLPTAFSRLFPRLLLASALAYLAFAPRWYRPAHEGKRS